MKHFLLIIHVRLRSSDATGWKFIVVDDDDDADDGDDVDF